MASGRDVDLTGRKFERWIVINRADKDKNGNILWKCRCKCGTVRNVAGTYLRNKRSLSCGCLRLERLKEKTRLPTGEAERNRVIGVYKTHAEERGLDYELSLDEFLILTQSNCFYCGSEPTPYIGRKRANGFFTGNGIDRVDNSIGYITGNVVPCCVTCNRSKLKRTVEEYKSWIKKSYVHMFS